LQRLDIREGRYWRPLGQDDMENSQYLEFLHPFTSAKESCDTYRTPGRARRGQSNRCFARAENPFLERAPAIGTCPGSCQAVRLRATAFWSPCSCPPSEQKEPEVGRGYVTYVGSR